MRFGLKVLRRNSQSQRISATQLYNLNRWLNICFAIENQSIQDEKQCSAISEKASLVCCSVKALSFTCVNYYYNYHHCFRIHSNRDSVFNLGSPLQGCIYRQDELQHLPLLDDGHLVTCSIWTGSEQTVFTANRQRLQNTHEKTHTNTVRMCHVHEIHCLPCSKFRTQTSQRHSSVMCVPISELPRDEMLLPCVQF